MEKINTNKKGRCPTCYKPVKGLYENIYRDDPKRRWKLRAYFCPKCNSILTNEQLVYEQINYVKKEVDTD